MQDFKFLNLNTDLPYLARKTGNFTAFNLVWDNRRAALSRIAENVFNLYENRQDCRETLSVMDAADREQFFKFHTED